MSEHTARLDPSPFHPGEQKIQTRLGVREQIENVGQRFIRDHLTGEHRQFLAQLPLLLAGSIDASGRPWASVLVGRPGFLKSPDPRTLDIHTPLLFGDPLNENLTQDSQLGMLGIEFATRRRNRLNGEVALIKEGLIRIKMSQTFGNCPQFIQAREYEFSAAIDDIGDARPVKRMGSLNSRAREIISQADNFFIATHYSDKSDNISRGADVSHRGGKPGFVRVEDEKTLTFPDFSGNYHFNTMGNILLNPRAGLLFIDFENGDLLYLTCSAEIIWDNEERRAFTGAERLLKLTLDECILVENSMPIRWGFPAYSPSLDQTGSWEEVAAKIDELNKGSVYQNYTVTKVEDASQVIKSFYLESEDGARIACHKAGQFLPVEVQPPGTTEPIRRTYTISSAPNGSFYRLSIKKEPGEPPGVTSNYFHDHVTVGSTIRAMTPRGKFVLDESSTRPIVLLSAGVGLTPMISMLEQLVKNSDSCGCNQQVWFIHGATNSRTHAFDQQVKKLAQAHPCLDVHIRYSQPLEGEIEAANYQSTGHVDIDLVKSLLTLDDYEFYLCGPAPFMESLYEGLKDISVPDERIHYEFFGPGATLLRDQPGETTGLATDISDRAPVPVQFVKSGKEAIWEPAKGTLLDLAESEGLQPAYSCRSGICQTCTTRVLSGEVDYTESPMTPPADGEALICCAYPKATDDTGNIDNIIVLDL